MVLGAKTGLPVIDGDCTSALHRLFLVLRNCRYGQSLPYCMSHLPSFAAPLTLQQGWQTTPNVYDYSGRGEMMLPNAIASGDGSMMVSNCTALTCCLMHVNS